MGPLNGLRILELGGIGPAPFCGMMLADMGAEVIAVQRPGADPTERFDPQYRSRRSLVCNLKQPEGVEVVRRLITSAEGLMEGFRPGVMERLGLGPDRCLEDHPGLVYGRVTGWGQDGPLAPRAGHDINYLALTGALKAIGRPGQPPVPPLNLVGDYGGGGMLLAFGMVCGLLHAQRTGEGQVVDAAMVDGANLLMSLFHRFLALDAWDDGPGTNPLGGAAHFYDTYETRDGEYVAIGALEPEFYGQLVDRLGLDPERFLPHGFGVGDVFAEPAAWSELRRELAEIFRQRTRREWCDLLEETDCCFAPVLGLSEAPDHPHHRARAAFVEVGGQVQPAPAPRFSRTAAASPRPAATPGADSEDLLVEAGFAESEIRELIAAGVVETAT